MLRSRFLVLALGLAPAGCISGQTGSPDCVGPTSCICDPLYGGGSLLRVHSELASDGKLVARVDEVLGEVYHPSTVRVGDRVGGSVLAEKPCARDEPSGTAAGAELFVLF